MKKLYKYIVLVIGILAFSACADEELVISFGETGSDVILKLGVQTQDIKDVVVSRNSVSSVKENTLYDLHIYVFDASGSLTGYEQIDFGKDGYDHTSEDPISIPVRTKTGNSFIYALANIKLERDTYNLSDENKNTLRVTDNNKPTLEAEYNETKELTGFITRIDDSTLKKKVEDKILSLDREDDFLVIDFSRVFSDEQGQNFSPTPGNGVFMMSGYINQGESVNIQRNPNDGTGSIAEGAGSVIELYRILAKNTLTIESTSAGEFIPKSYRLCNVPQGGILIPNANIETTSTYLAGNLTSAAVESGYRLYSDQSSITFYYPENLQIAKSNTDANPVKPYGEWQWKDRETNKWENNTKTFRYAADNAAYIEINGNYVSADGNTTADVTYTIHLGDFSKETGNIYDFNVIRNSHYIYKVTINGVEDIRVEAQRKVSADESKIPVDNPYAEGLVINATEGTHYEVDAHYEARVMTFKKSSISTLKGRGKGYILNISTPFGNTPQTLMVKETTYNEVEGYYICDLIGNPLAIIKENGTFEKISSDKIVFDGEADYNWIKFVRNGAPQVNPKTGEDIQESNVVIGSASTHICKYPGDNNRYSSDKKTGGWMNIFQLLSELYNTDNNTDGEKANDVYKHLIVSDKTDSGNDYVAYYTCFIDENYYHDEQWRNYVSWHDISDQTNGGRKSPRTMLIANNLDISRDGKSLYAEVEYSISQHPISTVYSNPNKNAFGTETIDEEDVYSNRLGSRAIATRDYSELSHYEAEDMAVPTETDDWDHNWDAFTCAYKTSVNFKNKNWYSGDDVAIKETIQPLYTTVAKACMSRNRDLNGDGIITPNQEDPAKNEVRWYLAAVDQYRALVFGQSGLTPDAHLISETELTAIKKGNDWGSGVNQNGHNDRGPLHYWTCSYEENAATFWPEEGLTNNPTSRYTSGNWISRAELVRCIRTLESEGYGADDPQKFYTYQDNIFTIDGIIVSRITTASPLIQHHERTIGINEFSSSFEVATGNLTTTRNNRVQDAEYSLTNILTQSDYCLNYKQQSDGSDLRTWRTPNQKEMALMLSNEPDLSKGNFGTRTQFTGNVVYGWHSVQGFRSMNGSLNVTTGNLKLRCVRDR